MLLSLVISLLVVGLFVIGLRQKAYMASNNVAGPLALPFVGTTFHSMVNYKNMLDYIVRMNVKYNRTWQLYGPNARIRVIFSNEPSSARHFLATNFKNYTRRTTVPRFVTLFGKGIFNSNDMMWKAHRKSARPLFTKQSIEGMVPCFRDKADIVCQQLEEARTRGEAIDIQDMFYAFTLDSMGVIGFGVNINSQYKPVAFSEAFNRAQRTIDLNGIFWILKLLPDKQFDQDIDTLRSFVNDIITERRQDSDLESRKDLLSRYMLLDNPETGEPYDSELLCDIILNFFIAGRDTTAVLLTWTFYLLSQNPDKEAKLIEEIDTVLNGKQDITANDLKDLPYLHCVLDETLRIYPSVPVDGRVAKEDDILPNGTFIPKDTLLLYSAYAMGRDPDLWEDPHKFIPERFEDTKKFKDPLQFISFHAGPQTCLGRSMAYAEAKIACVKILQKYTLRLSPGHVAEPVRAIVLPARYGMKMTVHPRTDKTV